MSPEKKKEITYGSGETKEIAKPFSEETKTDQRQTELNCQLQMEQKMRGHLCYAEQHGVQVITYAGRRGEGVRSPGIFNLRWEFEQTGACGGQRGRKLRY